MFKYIKKGFTAIDRWVHSKKGQKFAFYNDMAHSILIFGFMLPMGMLSWLWTNGAKPITIILVLSGLYGLYNAQKYYSRNYRY